MKTLETPAMAVLDALAAIDAGKVLVALKGKDERTIAFVYACRESPLAEMLASMLRRAEEDYEEMGEHAPNPYDLLDLIAQVVEREIETPETAPICREIVSILKGNADGHYTDYPG